MLWQAARYPVHPAGFQTVLCAWFLLCIKNSHILWLPLEYPVYPSTSIKTVCLAPSLYFWTACSVLKKAHSSQSPLRDSVYRKVYLRQWPRSLVDFFKRQIRVIRSWFYDLSKSRWFVFGDGFPIASSVFQWCVVDSVVKLGTPVHIVGDFVLNGDNMDENPCTVGVFPCNVSSVRVTFAGKQVFFHVAWILSGMNYDGGVVTAYIM